MRTAAQRHEPLCISASVLLLAPQGVGKSVVITEFSDGSVFPQEVVFLNLLVALGVEGVEAFVVGFVGLTRPREVALDLKCC